MATGLMCLELSSVAMGYRALAVVTRQNVAIVEAAPCGGNRFFILSEASEAELKILSQNVRTAFDGSGVDAIVDQEILPGDHRGLTAGIYSLAQVPVAESLVVIECETASALLATAHFLATAHHLKIIEVKIQRAGLGGGHAFLTGTSEQCGPAAEDARTHLKGAIRKGIVEVIEHPNDKFREYFNLSGTA